MHSYKSPGCWLGMLQPVVGRDISADSKCAGWGVVFVCYPNDR